MNELSKKIILAVTQYAVNVKNTPKINLVIAEIISQSEKTAHNRFENDDWSFEEVKLIAKATNDLHLKNFIRQQF